MNNIVLRPWQLPDASPLALIANNKNIWNNVLDSFPSPYTVKDAIQWINLQNNASPITKFAITYNQLLAGGIGYNTFDDVYKCSVELGYFIGEPFWNKGIATHAICTLTNHIFLQENITRIFARVYAFNKPSMRALEKAGFTLESIQQKAAIKNNIETDVFVWVKLKS
jgi:RimJ/RimL family protein N-acetyltransferase